MSPVRYRTIVADSARWDGFAHRVGDIVISAPPKSGTTWLQMICALLVFQRPDLPRRLDAISPWLDMQIRSRGEVVADLEAQRHRRILKTHTPLDGLPYSEIATYIGIGRDPRDVGVSWANHMANIDTVAFLAAREAAVGLDDLHEVMPTSAAESAPMSAVERFWRWIDDPAPPAAVQTTLRGTLHHLATLWSARERPNVVLLHYDELLNDLEGQMRLLAGRLGITVPADRWPELVRAASLPEMRRRADDLVPHVTHGLWMDHRRFFNRGTSGQWRAMLGADGLARYEKRVRELVDRDLSAWVHRGPVLR